MHSSSTNDGQLSAPGVDEEIRDASRSLAHVCTPSEPDSRLKDRRWFQFTTILLWTLLVSITVRFLVIPTGWKHLALLLAVIIGTFIADRDTCTRIYTLVRSLFTDGRVFLFLDIFHDLFQPFRRMNTSTPGLDSIVFAIDCFVDLQLGLLGLLAFLNLASKFVSWYERFIAPVHKQIKTDSRSELGKEAQSQHSVVEKLGLSGVDVTTTDLTKILNVQIGKSLHAGEWRVLWRCVCLLLCYEYVNAN